MNQEAALQRAVEFHGHLCPGLMAGLRMVAIAMRRQGRAHRLPGLRGRNSVKYLSRCHGTETGRFL